MKTIYSAVLLLLILGNSLFAQTNNLFDGFKFMNIPTNNLPIGALWNTTLGPIGNGVSDDQLLKSLSYSNLDMTINKDLKTSVDVGIKKFLSLNGGYNALSNISISVKKLEKLTLNSLDVLKANVGNQIIYEGLRASEFSIVIDKNKTADAQLDLMKIFSNLDMKVDINNNNTETITVSGANLFIAYRVAEVEIGKKNSKKLKFTTQGYSSDNMVKLSSTYESVTPQYVVAICPCNIQKCMAESYENGDTARSLFSHCAATVGFDLKVILKNIIDMKTGKPQEYKYIIKNPGGSINNYNQSIYSKPTSSGLEVSYLNFERLVYETIGESRMIYMLHQNKNRNVSLVTESFKFNNVVPSSVAGW